jgi:hypothetical protein
MAMHHHNRLEEVFIFEPPNYSSQIHGEAYSHPKESLPKRLHSNSIHIIPVSEEPETLSEHQPELVLDNEQNIINLFQNQQVDSQSSTGFQCSPNFLVDKYSTTPSASNTLPLDVPLANLSSHRSPDLKPHRPHSLKRTLSLSKVFRQ